MSPQAKMVEQRRRRRWRITSDIAGGGLRSIGKGGNDAREWERITKG